MNARLKARKNGEDEKEGIGQPETLYAELTGKDRMSAMSLNRMQIVNDSIDYIYLNAILVSKEQDVFV